MWPATRESIELELRRELPALTTTQVQDLARVGLFLTDINRVKAALAILEKRVDLLANRQLAPSFFSWDRALSDVERRRRVLDHYEDWKARFEARRGGNLVQESALAHLVTRAMGTIEQNEDFEVKGFGVFGHPYKVLLMMPLAAQTFLSNLQKGRHWKDIVGVNHGEYTHRLQWCLASIVMYDMSYLFRSIGAMPTKQADNKQLSVWDLIVDRAAIDNINFGDQWPAKAEDDLDFRSPENFLTWMCRDEQQQEFPLVCGFLKNRKDKRAYQQEIGFDAAQYIAQKLYGYTGDIRKFEHQLAVDEYLQGGTDGARENVETEVGLLTPTRTSYTHPRLPR